MRESAFFWSIEEAGNARTADRPPARRAEPSITMKALSYQAFHRITQAALATQNREMIHEHRVQEQALQLVRPAAAKRTMHRAHLAAAAVADQTLPANPLRVNVE